MPLAATAADLDVNIRGITHVKVCDDTRELSRAEAYEPLTSER
jgi:hypothetical protein